MNFNSTIDFCYCVEYDNCLGRVRRFRIKTLTIKYTHVSLLSGSEYDLTFLNQKKCIWDQFLLKAGVICSSVRYVLVCTNDYITYVIT